MSLVFEQRTLSTIVLPKNGKIFSECATTVRIEDEASGEFVIVSQHGHTERGEIAINPEEWPLLRQAIDQMIAECRGDEE